MIVVAVGLSLCVQMKLIIISFLYHPTLKNDTINPNLLRPYIPVSTSGLPTYTQEMAIMAIRPALWTCGEDKSEVAIDPLTNHKIIFSFVHVFKTAGSTMRDFFQKYSIICSKAWMLLIHCTGVDSSTIISNQDWKKCIVKQVDDARRIIHDDITMEKEIRLFPKVNNTILRDSIDIYGGHFKIGTGDYIFPSSANATEYSTKSPSPVRHIVFLRNPLPRFVSGFLFKRRYQESESLEATVKLIKEQICEERKKNQYWLGSLSYLLTPIQAHVRGRKMQQDNGLTRAEQSAEVKARTAIQNLVKYNCIVGMTEAMEQSMSILRHVLVPDNMLNSDRKDDINWLFDQYAPSDGKVNNKSDTNDDETSNKGVRINTSPFEEDGVSTELVLNELSKDATFMQIFQEYVKYEKLITDYAWRMHQIQYEETLL